ncbi:hypothetical protein [Acinetobacter baumannii]|uniref:hypothetical protein n=1 Tax=Acinetobacter baumannii TaxID=470 RepID=UPI00107FFA13|nr:hypothetical protein [Acinetobacter baumannii]QBY16329.1 hypothetical protein E4664_20385 [Acinetobacter baumannii]
MSWRIALLLIISWRKQSTGYATLFSPHTPQMTIAPFLANLALNKNTQEKVLNIRNSLNDIKLDKTGKPYPSRFPSVIPPHSTTMSLTAEGIWLENGKRFLITHVSKVSPIADFPIVAYAPVTESEEQIETIDKDKVHRQGRNKKKTQ